MTSRTTWKLLYLLNSLSAVFFWVYFLSAGFQTPGLLDGVYELQAQALAKFQLSIEPGPRDVFYFDVCLFKGKFYFYQGMLPAFFHAVLMKFLGPMVSSYLVAIGFLFCFCYFFQRIIGDIIQNTLTLTDKYKSYLQLSALPLLWLLVFNLPFPVQENSWFFGRFAIYEQQIVFALAVMMPALFLLIRGVQNQNGLHIGAAVFICSLAAWVRVTWLPFAGMVVLASFFYSAWQRNGKLISLPLTPVFFWLVASIFLLGGLLWSNYLRFDSFFEFGQRHLNPVHPVYLRTIVGEYSPVTKFWGILFNLFAYYGSPDLVGGLGLIGKSASNWEYFPPSYFHFNPQFIPVLLLIPFGVYKSFHRNRNIFLMTACVGLTAVYINAIVIAFGPLVIMRYFIEFYYFTLVLFFLAIVSLLPYRFALPVIILLLCVYLPGNLSAFLNIRPELRATHQDGSLAVMVDKSRPRTPYMEENPVWFRQTVSAKYRDNFRAYNAIGVHPGPGVVALKSDLAALYIVPASVDRRDCSKRALVVKGFKSIGAAGTVRFYIDGSYTGKLRVNEQSPADGCYPVPIVDQPMGPYQVLVAFIPHGKQYLPPRASKKTVIQFDEVSLTLHN